MNQPYALSRRDYIPYDLSRLHAFLIACGHEVGILEAGKVPKRDFAMIVVQGFEERSSGAMARLRDAGYRARSICILQYPGQHEANSRYQEAVHDEAYKLSRREPHYFNLGEQTDSLEKAIKSSDSPMVLLDITAMSNRLIFAAFDAAARSGRKVIPVYTDAVTYSPSREKWEAVEGCELGPLSVADIVEQQEWISNSNYCVSIVEDHEGYDGAGIGKALVAFLPFKSARLSSIIANEDYSSFHFLAVKPRSPCNAWRLEALKKVNAPYICGHVVTDISAFGYVQAAGALSRMLLGKRGIMRNHDVHLAVLGSKLQTVGAWIVSSFIDSITVVACTPEKFYPQSYSEGIGETWLLDFPLEIV